jgi:16S rRNA A1518/A1519 N6-dimethyltransferase RsmA/KsgA/DIM1 with predicted DNA glycosylase/AP lyase activity
MSATIDRGLPIAVTLAAEQWQAVMQVLSNGPYNVVAPLIGQIQQQCMRHAEPQREVLPMHMARPNGEEQPDA